MKKNYSARFLMTLLNWLLCISVLFADQPSAIILVNTGKMHIDQGGINGVAMYVPYAIKHEGDTTSVVLEGEMNLGGNFYQEATTPVFKVDATTTSKSFSNGILRFVDDWGQNRLITASDIGTTYDRGVRYIAFPNIHINTDDYLPLHPKMGIDARTLKVENNKQGRLILQSDLFDDKVYDASLRITGSGISADLVDQGAVIVEREMSYYRSASGSEKLFGFATPFKNTQLSGYFAGNWVRRPIASTTTGHTQYVFGNETAPNNTILLHQYIINPLEVLVPSQAYLIRPRPTGFDYEQLNADGSGLTITAGQTYSDYDQSKFTFNGQVYQIPTYDEQLFAEDAVFVSKSIASTSSTINWLVGNSYTAPVSVEKLVEAMASSTLKFSPYIWIYPAGSTTYQSYKITGSDNIYTCELSEIPAMSIFMIRVLSGTSPGQFTISRDMQRHAKVSHNTLMKAPSMSGVPSHIKNQVLFRVSPSDNNRVYDLAAVGLRSGAKTGSDSYDMAKVYAGSDVFQLYTLSSANVQLSANGLPLDAESVKLCFRPESRAAVFKLNSIYAQSLSAEGLWIEDTKTGEVVDMLMNDSYEFVSEPGDDEERFMVYFKRRVSTSVHSIDSKGLSVVAVNDMLQVRNLTNLDADAVISLYDMSGRMLKSVAIEKGADHVELPFAYLPGVYLLHLKGERNLTVKFVK